MKKLLSVILVVISLFLLAGCGSGKIDSGDSESKYPYGWTENADGTITVKISGRWDKKCAWRAEYDEETLICTSNKKGNAFTIGSLDARTGEVDLRLYREGQEMWEYSICIHVQGNGSGGVVVLSTTHEEPVYEGSYTVSEQGDNSVLISIHTTHDWDSRLVSSELSADLSEKNAESCSFRITAQEPCEGIAELLDEEGSRLLIVHFTAVENGKLTVSDVEESDDIAFGEAQLETFWKILGFSMPFVGDVTVNDAKIVNDMDHLLLTYGVMDITVAGEDYEYAIALDDRLTELYGFGSMEAEGDAEDDADDEVSAPTAVTSKDVGGVTVSGYADGKDMLAVWKQFGCTSVLTGKGTCESAIAAAEVLIGVMEDE